MAEKDYYSILELTDEDKKLKGKEFNDRVSKNFESLEQIWEEYDVYEKSDNSDRPLKP